MSTGKLSPESPLGLLSGHWPGHLTLHSEQYYRPQSPLNFGGRVGPALFKHIQTGIMSILLQKTMDKISNLCLGTHKNKWKFGISLVREYVLYRSQVQYNSPLLLN